MDLNQDQVKQLAKRSQRERLEIIFLEAWLGEFPSLPAPARQYRFHPKRKWMFDYAWPDQKLAVELDGGSWIRGGHNRPQQQQKDYEKANEAVRAGWRVLRFNTLDMADVLNVVTLTAEVLTNARDIHGEVP